MYNFLVLLMKMVLRKTNTRILIFQLALIFISFNGIAQISKTTPDSSISINKNCVLRYPSIARKNGIQGTVKIKIVFDSSCSIKDYKVVKSLGYGCDEAAIDCLVMAQEKIKKEKGSKCQEGFEIIYPFYFKLAE